MIAFKTKQAHLIDPFNQITDKVVAAVTEININKLSGDYLLKWNYFLIVEEDGEEKLVKLDPHKRDNFKEYTLQQVLDYHTANPTTETLLPEIEDKLFFKSLKSQVVADGILGLSASDWEPHA